MATPEDEQRADRQTALEMLGYSAEEAARMTDEQQLRALEERAESCDAALEALGYTPEEIGRMSTDEKADALDSQRAGMYAALEALGYTPEEIANMSLGEKAAALDMNELAMQVTLEALGYTPEEIGKMSLTDKAAALDAQELAMRAALEAQGYSPEEIDRMSLSEKAEKLDLQTIVMTETLIAAGYTPEQIARMSDQERSDAAYAAQAAADAAAAADPDQQAAGDPGVEDGPGPGSTGGATGSTSDAGDPGAANGEAPSDDIPPNPPVDRDDGFDDEYESTDDLIERARLEQELDAEDSADDDEDEDDDDEDDDDSESSSDWMTDDRPVDRGADVLAEEPEARQWVESSVDVTSHQGVEDGAWRWGRTSTFDGVDTEGVDEHSQYEREGSIGLGGFDLSTQSSGMSTTGRSMEDTTEVIHVGPDGASVDKEEEYAGVDQSSGTYTTGSRSLHASVDESGVSYDGDAHRTVTGDGYLVSEDNTKDFALGADGVSGSVTDSHVFVNGDHRDERSIDVGAGVGADGVEAHDIAHNANTDGVLGDYEVDRVAAIEVGPSGASVELGLAGRLGDRSGGFHVAFDTADLPDLPGLPDAAPVDAALDGAQAVGDDVQGAIDDASDAVHGAVDDAGDAVQGVVDDVGDALGGLFG